MLIKCGASCLGCRLPQLSTLFIVVEGQQHLSAADMVAFLHQHLFNRCRDPSRNRNRLPRFDITRRVNQLRCRAKAGVHDFDRNWLGAP